MTLLLLLAQLAVWQPVSPPVLHQGWISSCDGDGEYVLQHRVLGDLRWELHIEGADFGLYGFRVSDHNHTHRDKVNLLSAPGFDDLNTQARQWTVPSLKLWLSVVRAGSAEAGCEAFHIRVEKQ
jgi:hypothetical protein